MGNGSLLSVAIIEASEKEALSSSGEEEGWIQSAPHYLRATSPVCEFPSFVALSASATALRVNTAKPYKRIYLALIKLKKKSHQKFGGIEAET